jgi:hypothetical protein
VDPSGLSSKDFANKHNAIDLLLKDIDNWKNINNNFKLTIKSGFKYWRFNTKYREDYKELSFNPENQESCNWKWSAGGCIVFINLEQVELSQIWNFLIWYNYYYAWFSLDNRYGMFYNDIFQAWLFTEDVIIRKDFLQNTDKLNDAYKDEQEDRLWYKAWYNYAEFESRWGIADVSHFLSNDYIINLKYE